MRKAFKAAFPVTIPVMLGYITVGMAFGLLADKSGYGILWVLLMGLAIYAGSMQFVIINLIASSTGILSIGLMTLFVNIRHMFYGLSFIDSFKSMGKKRIYMIYSLTDETYSLLCSAKAPHNVDEGKFFLCLSALNQIYWLIGTLLGSLAGSLISFNTSGIDFAMTALFIVIFIEQWQSFRSHLPALIGIVASLASFLIFGPDNVILPSMLAIVLLLILFKGPIEEKTHNKGEGRLELHEC